MPLREVSQTSAPCGLVVPDCPNCEQPDRVGAVMLDGVSPGVHYWRCEECGFV
jgi:hypothetical protein